MKIKFVLELIKQVEKVPAKFLAPITDYEGLYEVRVEFESNIYRIFCFFDRGKLVVLFNGFQKNTQKTPVKAIKKAMRLKQEYFESKNKSYDKL
jgi:phage-related protein